MTQTSSLNPEQRFTKENPCPVCGGHKDLAQGKSERCWGFLSEDRKYAHCTREEYAGNLEQHPNSDTFSHKLSGDCKCGVSHNGHNETVTNLSSFSRPTDVYKIKDDEGNLIALHERYDLGSRKKKFKWRRRPNGPANLGGLPVADLPLYGSEKARDWADDQMIILVEGEKPAEALWAREFCALGTVTGAKSTSNTKPLEVLRGRKVIVWPDEDSDGFSHMERVAHSLKGIASSVTFFQWEGAPDKADAADHPAILSGDEDALQDLLKELREAPEWEDRESLKDELEGKKGAHEGGNQADRLIGYAQDKVEKYFKDQNGEPHALVDGEPMPLNSRCYVWLRKLMFDREGGSCTAEALKSAAGTMAAFAEFSGEEIELHTRSAFFEGAVYYELGPRRVVRISPKSYELVEESPVLFRRYPNLKELPDPEPGGNLNDLTGYANLKTERDRRLFRAYATTVPLPHVPRPILNKTGAMGSGKTTLDRFIKRLLDPTVPEFVRVGYRDFLQKAAHAYILALDNQSILRDESVDMICRLVTGEADSKRRLYTDDEDLIYQLRRAVLCNAINPPSDRGDFNDRSLMLELERIPDTKRKDEEELWELFEENHGRLLGAVFDALSKVLAKRPHLKLSRKPRLADWGGYAAAVYEVMSFEEEEDENEEADKKLAGADLFLEDWDSVVRVQNQATLDGSPVALAIAAFMQDNGEYEAPASALHKELETAAEGINIDTARDKMWPKSARWLWRRIKEVQPVLEAIGVEATRNHTATGSKITLLKKSENDVSNVSAHEKPIDKGETPDDNPDISDESNVSLASNVSSNVSSDSRHLSGSDDTDDTDIIFSSTTSGDVRAEECLHGMIGGCDQCRKNRLSPFFDGLDDDTDEGSSEDDGERRIEWLS